MIGIETTRYSTLMKRILSEFNDNVTIQIGIETYSPRKFKTYSGVEIPELLNDWCTKKNLIKTTFFHLKQNGEELFGWWDHPENMWADISVLPFIEKLAAEKLIRYNIAVSKPSKFSQFLKKIFRNRTTA